MTTLHSSETTRPPEPAAEAFFAGPGEMRARCRALDWAATPLGPVAAWPTSLRTAAAVVLGHAFASVVCWGPELVQLYNDGYIAVHGAKHPWGLGRPTREVWPEVWHLNAPLFARAMAGETVALEHARYALARNGPDAPPSDVFVNLSFSPVPDDAGGVGGVLVTLIDTTAEVTTRQLQGQQARLLDALDRERARLADMFRDAPSFLAVMRGPEHVLERVNDAYYQLVGRGNVIGRPVAEALPEAAAQGFVGLLDRVFETGEPFIGREIPIRLQRTPSAPPEERFLDFVYQPVAEPDGTRSGVVAHGTDVTAYVHARRAAEAARAEADAARRAAEQGERLKSEFLATMSHEFRTPLNAILGYAQLLDLGILGETTPAQHAHLERLQASARHLLQLVDDVLDVAKVDAERMDVRHDRLATGAAVAAALALVQPQATAKGLRVEDRGVAGPGVPYVGDEHRVRQILVNLLANAVKFTPGGGTITIECGVTAAPDFADSAGAQADGDARPWTYIRVADTGPGIARPLRQRLFEPFVQGDGSHTRQHGGTGLGLAISRRLARLMGGDLVLDAGAGPDSAHPGAVFTLWLPAPTEAAGAAPPVAANRAAPRRTPTGTSAVASERPTGGGVPLDAAAYAVLHALGVRLAADAERVAERYAAALRAEAARADDGRFPGARELPDVQLRDHATPQVGLLATQLMTVGETHGRAPELLADGAELQRVMAELHGAQRHRLGWSEVDIERETPLLSAEVERSLAGALRPADGGPAREEPMAGSDSVAAAAGYAADVARHMLTQSARVALRAYQAAKEAAR